MRIEAPAKAKGSRSARDLRSRMPLATRPPGRRRGQFGRPRPRRRPHGPCRLVLALQILANRGLVCRSVWASGRRLATLLSATPSLTVAELADSPERHCLLSRSHIDAEGNVVVESPLALAQLVLHDSRVAILVSALAVPATAQDLVAQVRESFRPRQSRYC